MKTVVLDWHTWEPIQKKESRSTLKVAEVAEPMAAGALIAYLYEIIAPQIAQADTVTALADGTDSMGFNSDAGWADYVIPMLKHQGLPLAATMCVWAGLEMILRKPASAIDRAKWAVVGYLGLQFVLPFLTHLGHRFGDV